MAILDFDGDTFVAFLDISGFKEMMNGDGSQAVKALDKLYQTGFDELKKNENVAGIFISDCGVLFINNETMEKKSKLEELLNVIKEINKELIVNDIMTTTSIAYGHFSYRQKIEFKGIEKNHIFGYAYISAFLDNEKATPRIKPGQCRIILDENDDIKKFNIPLLKEKGKHCYYYWMIENENYIEDFEKNYNNSYKQKYAGMLSALKSNRTYNM